MTLLKKELNYSFLLKAREVCEVTWWLHSYPLNRKSPQRGWSIKGGERNHPFCLHVFQLLMGAKCYLEIFWYLFSLQNVTIHGLLRRVHQGSQSCGGACCSGCPWTAKSHSRVEEGPPDGGTLLSLWLYRKLKNNPSQASVIIWQSVVEMIAGYLAMGR